MGGFLYRLGLLRRQKSKWVIRRHIDLVELKLVNTVRTAHFLAVMKTFFMQVDPPCQYSPLFFLFLKFPPEAQRSTTQGDRQGVEAK